MGKDLLSEFEAGSEKQWIDKITNDLKGKPISSLIWQSEIGDINPIIFSTENSTSDSFESKENNTWNNRQLFDAEDSNCNKQIITALSGGVNAIEIANLSVSNIDLVLNDVMLDIISVHINLNHKNPCNTIQVYKDYCLSKNQPLENLKGGFEFDPIGQLAISGNWIENQSSDLAEIQQIITTAESFSQFTLLNINASLYCEAGANIDKQITFALAHANEYLNLFGDDKDALEKLINKIQFTFGTGTSYFLEIAKTRAFKSLWSSIVSQYLETDFKISSKIHIVNSNLYYSNKDQYNNLLRATTAGMSAVIAGCDSLTLLPFSYNYKENDPFALRIAKNIQLILQEESYINQVIDASKGAYYIENVIQQLKENAWAKFLEIEKSGGLLKSLLSETIQNDIKNDFQAKVSNLSNGDKIMIGVNKFINETEDKLSSIKVTSESQSIIVKPITSKRLANSYE